MATKKELPSIGEVQSVFQDQKARVYPFAYAVTVHCERVVGGTPSNPRVAKAWLETKFRDRDAILHDMVGEIMAKRGISAEEAIEQADILKHLNGFMKDEKGIYLEGRCIKAGIKEAANIRWPKERWGPTNKGTLGFVSEHIFVTENKVHIARRNPLVRTDERGQDQVVEPAGLAKRADDVMQRFVSTWRGTGIQYEEYVDDATLSFTVQTDYPFEHDRWAELWLTGEQQGLGASRSQGFGRYKVIQWDQVAGPKVTKELVKKYGKLVTSDDDDADDTEVTPVRPKARK